MVARASTAASMRTGRRTPADKGRLTQVGRGAAEGGAPDLDRVIHERLRLGIVSALAVTEWLAFTELKALMRTTDGNLSVHARKLEEAHYVECHKSFEGRVPKTRYRLTSTGRQALQRYLQHMEAIIRATRAR